MIRKLNSFLRDTSGVTSIEYGMIAVLISIGILAALNSMSVNLLELYNLILGAFS